MVQQQETEKALFKQQQAATDAKTSIIKARADAESIRIQGEALQKNPQVGGIEDGGKVGRQSPQVMGGSTSMLMPMSQSSEPTR